MSGWPRLPWAFPWVLKVCEASWVRHELAGDVPYPPPYISAVAAMWDVDAAALWELVEGVHGWEPHNTGYRQRVWSALWEAPLPPATVRLRHNLYLPGWRLGRGRVPFPGTRQQRNLATGLAYARARYGHWVATGLPPGMAVDPDTGTLSGMPAAAGEYSGSVWRLEGDNLVGPWRYRRP